MITRRQKEVLNFIQSHQSKLGYRPSLEQIKLHLKISSVSTAHYHVNKLKESGYLGQDNNLYLSLVNQKVHDLKDSNDVREENATSIPILGTANAGEATFFAIENLEGYIKLPKGMRIKNNEVFALRAAGDSMNEALIGGKNIEDGDYVVIDSSCRVPRNGDYVLSIIDNYANLKKYDKDKRSGEIRLVSESSNPSHKPIFISSEDDFMINGKIVAVVKK